MELRPPAAADQVLAELLDRLVALDYNFVTPTPATHQRYLQRNRRRARSLRDIFGWSLPFSPADIDADLLALLERGAFIEPQGHWLRPLIRVSSLGGALFVHSAFPTLERDAVFFGPDTYRFAAFIMRELPASDGHILDIGAGSGAGGISAVRAGKAARATLLDINARALWMAGHNARAANIAAETTMADLTALPDQTYDAVVMNPPYMVDGEHRQYRDGGEDRGLDLAVSWTLAATHLVKPGGQILVYCGSPVVEGEVLLAARLMGELGPEWRMEASEIDPDIFGEELDREEYRDVERIAALGIRIEGG
ncbi:methyltransferase [Allosphingosinicella indica]|uniref:Methylase of polypeptide chain release factors n=1 Tax=Allosphingosinicella indica TaxID=941907 RepID=A0A1X7FZQ9_9SPHN|nr:methyltransferase [Allosphingosinicella indica]SMF61227.1 Methylase of polypeptide chain release factors [Allosphingosinicella indica]